MKATLKKEEGLKREYEVLVPAKDITTRRNAELTKLSRKVKIAGFRPGKIPMDIMEKRYGTSVDADILDSMVRETIEKTIAENKLRPALEPKIENAEKFENGKDFKYSFSVEIFPDLPKVDYSKIKLEKQVGKIAEDDIKEGLKMVTSQSKSFEPIKETRKAKKGENVKFDFTGRKDGVEFEGGKAEDFQLELGSGQFIPGFEEQLIGMKQGEEKTFPITFPKEYHSPDLAGAATEFTVKLKEILEVKEAEADDKLAEQLGFKDLKELKDKISEQIRKDFDGISYTKLKKALFDKLEETLSFEIPEGMVKIDYDQVLKQIQAEEKDGDKKAQEKEARKLAERRVRLGILLSEVSRQNSVQVTNDELRQAVTAKAMSYPGQEKQIFDFYQKNPNALDQVRGEILEDKAVEYILKQVEVKEITVSREELLTEEGHVHDENCGHNHSHDKPKAKKPAAKKPAEKKSNSTNAKKKS